MFDLVVALSNFSAVRLLSLLCAKDKGLQRLSIQCA
jgi:hypothetical protein